ncbi:MAG: prefoldin subunit alpha [Methermicoccaceae archaeon]
MEQKEQKVPSKEELTEMYVNYQQLRVQAEALAKELEVLRASVSELQNTLEGLDTLKGKDNAELLIPVGSGAMMKARLEDEDTVVVSIGAGLSIERPLDESKTYLEDRKDEIFKSYEMGSKSLARLTSQIQEIGLVLERYLGERGLSE